MTRIYLSSTYSDLREQREAIYKVLRRLGHDVVGTEDYVATDQRPMDSMHRRCTGFGHLFGRDCMAVRLRSSWRAQLDYGA